MSVAELAYGIIPFAAGFGGMVYESRRREELGLRFRDMVPIFGFGTWTQRNLGEMRYPFRRLLTEMSLLIPYNIAVLYEIDKIF